MLCKWVIHDSCSKVLILTDKIFIRVLTFYWNNLPCTLDNLFSQEKVTLKSKIFKLVHRFVFVDDSSWFSSQSKVNSLTIARCHYKMKNLTLRILNRLDVDNIVELSPLIFGQRNISWSSIHFVHSFDQLIHLNGGLVLEFIAKEAKVKNFDHTLALGIARLADRQRVH